MKANFWNAKYIEIIEIFSPQEFTTFFEFYQLAEAFTLKFTQMKQSFDRSEGNPKVMGKACYDDLVELSQKMTQIINNIQT